MNSTSRLDRLITELRQQLAVSTRATPAGSSIGSSPESSISQVPVRLANASPLSAVKALKDAGVSDEKLLVKRYVEELLKRDFSGKVFNDAVFQQSLADLMELLEEDHDAWTACLSCVRQ